MAVWEFKTEHGHVAGSGFLTECLEDFGRDGYFQQEHALRAAVDGGSFEVPSAEYLFATARGYLDRHAAKLEDLLRKGWLLVQGAPRLHAKASEPFTEGDA